MAIKVKYLVLRGCDAVFGQLAVRDIEGLPKTGAMSVFILVEYHTFCTGKTFWRSQFQISKTQCIPDHRHRTERHRGTRDHRR